MFVLSFFPVFRDTRNQLHRLDTNTISIAHPPMDIVTNIVDQQARANPDGLYAEYPISDWNYDEGLS